MDNNTNNVNNNTNPNPSTGNATNFVNVSNIGNNAIKFAIVTVVIALVVWLLYGLSTSNSYVATNKTISFTAVDVSDEAFLKAAASAKAQEIEKLINLGANLKAVDEIGRNALSIAITVNFNPNVVKALVNPNTINTADNNGYTPLMLALSSSASFSTVQYLLQNNANANAVTKSGISVLMLASSSVTNPKIVDLLIKYGAKVNYTNASGVSALMLAVKINSNPQVIQTLLKYNANTKQKDNLGISVYENALSNPYLKDNKQLLNKLK